MSLSGVSTSHSLFLLRAFTLMNEKSATPVEIGMSRRELLFFSGLLWVSKTFPRKGLTRRLSFILPERSFG